MSNEIFSAPRDRALEPGRVVGSGLSMGRRVGPPKFNPGDSSSTKPGSMYPKPKNNVDPGFSKKMPAPPSIKTPGIAKPGPYTGPTGGMTKTMPYTPGPGPKFENMPYKPQG